MDHAKERGRPGDTVATSEGTEKLDKTQFSTKRPFKQEASFEAFKRRVVALETVADWQDDLTSRLNRAQLRFELIGFDIAEQRALYAEGQAFMKPLTRRSVATGLAAAVAAPALVALRIAHDDTELLTAIRYYRDRVSNKALRGFEDDELDAAVDAAQKPLVALIDTPALTAAGALAALDLLIAEHHVEVVNEYESEYMDIMTSLARSVRSYLASVA